jgi:hypothetical protein
MKTFFSITLLLSTLCGTSQAAGVRKATTEEVGLAALKQEDFDGKMSFDELGIETDREAGFFCDFIIGLVDVLPDYLSCGCEVSFFTLSISFSCSAKVCEGDQLTTGLLADGTCFEPSYAGDFSLLRQTLTSKLCNEAMNITAEIEQGTFNVSLPKVCATLEHAPLALRRLRSCKIKVGDYECPCTICESESDISFNCTGAVQELGEEFAAEATATCVGLSLIGGKKDKDGKVGTFVSSAFLLGN